MCSRGSPQYVATADRVSIPAKRGSPPEMASRIAEALRFVFLIGPPMLPVLSIRKTTSARQEPASDIDCACAMADEASRTSAIKRRATVFREVVEKYPSQCQHRVVGKDYALASGKRQRVHRFNVQQRER